MKKIILTTILFLSLVTHIYASEKNNSNNLDIFTLKNGIPVYLLPNKANRIDFLSISVRGGTLYLDEEHSGLENVLFSMMSEESKNFSRDEILSHKYESRSYITGRAGSLNASLSMTCIDTYFEKNLAILTDCFLSPKLDKRQWEIKLNDYRQSLQQEMNDPESMMFYFANQLIYQNHPLNVKSTPTVESVYNLKYEDMLDLHKKEMDPRRILIIAVTNFDTASLLDYLNNTLGNLSIPDTEIKSSVIPPLEALPNDTLALTHPSCGESGHVARAVLAESVTGKDYMAFLLAELIYNKIMYSVIRGKYGACYTPYVTSYGNQANVAFEMI